MSKYGNVRTEYNGQVYASKAEAAYARHLDAQLAAGEILAWERGTPWVLLEEPDGIEYTPDFHVWDKGRFYAVDVKGHQTEVFRLKRRLWRRRYPTVPLLVVLVPRGRWGTARGPGASTRPGAPAAGQPRRPV